MIVAILLASYRTAPAMTPAANEQQAASSTQAAPLLEKPIAEQPRPTASATSLPSLIIPVTTVFHTPATNDAEVTANILNVRVGPGMNHRIMTQLAAGQKVSLEGRSQNSEWVAVRLADGKEGWVYSSYLSTDTDLTSLPVMEAYGGPVTLFPEIKPNSKPSGRYTLNVSINYNQVEVHMSGFAAERDVTLRLVVPGEGPAMTIAATTTGADGSADLTIPMPTSWPDGSAVTQSEMELQILGSDGMMQGKAKIFYQSGD